MNKSLMVLAIFSLFLSLAIPTSAQNTYVADFHVTNDTSSPINVYSVPFSGSGTCTNEISTTVTLNGTGFDVFNTIFSPLGTTAATSELEDVNSLTCRSMGTTEQTSLESSAQLVHDATGGNITIRNIYTCVTNNRFYDIIINADTEPSTVPNRYVDLRGFWADNITFFANASDALSNECGGTLASGAYVNFSETGAATPTAGTTLVTYYPFNSSGGAVRYNFSAGDTGEELVVCDDNAPETYNVYNVLILYDVVDGTFTILHDSGARDCQGGRILNDEHSGSLSLTQDREYMFIKYQSADDCNANCGGYSHSLREHPFVNISIDIYKGTFVCGAWSVCGADGFRQRTCTDTGGIAPDDLQIATCSLTFAQNATFGFEEFRVNGTVYECIADGYNLFNPCLPTSTTFSVEIPANWTVVQPGSKNINFLRMTDDWATEGTRSLMMWIHTPSPYAHSAFVPGACFNLTTARIPQVYTDVNESYFATLNVTFPDENMLILYDVKACAEPVEKFGAIIFEFPFFPNTTRCERECYGDCDVQPTANYKFNIFDPDNLQSIIGGERNQEAETIARTHVLQLPNLIVNKTYRLTFASWTDDIFTNTGNCVMFDNVRYATTVTDVTGVGGVAKDCKTTCLGFNKYEARELPNGGCSIVIKSADPFCATTREQADAMTNASHPTFCDGDTAYIFDEKLGKYPDDGEANSELCAALAVEQAELDALTETGVQIVPEGSDYDGFNFILSPFFVAFILNMIVAGMIAGAIATAGQTGGSGITTSTVGVVFLITFLIVAVILSWLGLYPLIVGALITVLCGLGLAVLVKEMMGGG